MRIIKSRVRNNPALVADLKLLGSKSIGSNSSSLTFNPTGTIMYIGKQDNDTVYQHQCSEPFIGYTSVEQGLAFSGTFSQGSSLREIAFNETGTKAYTAMDTNNLVYQYSLSTPWAVSSATYDSITLGAGDSGTPPLNKNLCYTNNRLFWSRGQTDVFVEHQITNPASISGAPLINSFNHSSIVGDIQQVCFSSAGNHFYAFDNG
jgi:hypothetical protein